MARLRRSVLPRPLSWRSPWTILLGILAAFQAGVIGTLLWTSRGSDPTAPAPSGSAATTDDERPPTRSVVEPPPAAPPSPPAPPARPVVTPSAPAPRLLEVEVVSEPEGATVRIGGAVWGVTPLSAFLPATSPLRIYLELDGYRRARVTWSPASGKRQIDVVLEPLSQP